MSAHIVPSRKSVPGETKNCLRGIAQYRRSEYRCHVSHHCMLHIAAVLILINDQRRVACREHVRNVVSRKNVCCTFTNSRVVPCRRFEIKYSKITRAASREGSDESH